MSTGPINASNPYAGASASTGSAIEPPANESAQMYNVMVSSVVTDSPHGRLLASLGAPPATWDLRQSGTY